jgi:hypothetical protein
MEIGGFFGFFFSIVFYFLGIFFPIAFLFFEFFFSVSSCFFGFYFSISLVLFGFSFSFFYLFFPIIICLVIENSLKNKVNIYLLYYISCFYFFYSYLFNEIDRNILVIIFCFLIFINILKFIFLLRNGKKFSLSKALEFLCIYFNLGNIGLTAVMSDVKRRYISRDELNLVCTMHASLMFFTLITCLIIFVKRKDEREIEKDRIERLKKNEKKL